MAKGIKGSCRAFYKCVCSKGWARERVSPLLSGKEKHSKDASERVEVLNEFFILSALPERVSRAASMLSGNRGRIGLNREGSRASWNLALGSQKTA